MEELKIEVLEIQERRVVAKIGRLRKPRALIAFTDDKGHIIAQGDDVIFEIDPETRVAIYNTKGSLFVHLHPAMGAKVAKVPQEFIDALRQVIFREGDLIGHLPAELGGSPVFFGGCKRV